MALNSYRLDREFASADPIDRMLYEKKKQIESLYQFANDRESNVTLNHKPFIKSPRIFDRSENDTVHTRISVLVIEPDDYFVCGDYIQFEDAEWLCLNSYIHHDLYCKGKFQKCNTVIYWQDAKTLNIKSKPAYIHNATKYNVGETRTETIAIPSAKHLIEVGCDEDTVLLDTPIRLVLDKNNYVPSVYQVTQNDCTTVNYGKGICNITVLQDTLNYDTDKKVELNGHTVWIADYIEPINSDEGGSLDNSIYCYIDGENTLKIGFPREYIVSFVDNYGNTLNNVAFSYELSSDFDGKIKHRISNNIITLRADDESLLDEVFDLRIFNGGLLINKLEIKICSLY